MSLKLDITQASPMMMNQGSIFGRGTSKNMNDANNNTSINNNMNKNASSSSKPSNNNDNCLELLPIMKKVAQYMCGANCNNVSDEIIMSEEEKNMIFADSSSKLNHHTTRLKKETKQNTTSVAAPPLTSSTSCSSNGTSKTMNSSTNSLLSIDVNDPINTTTNASVVVPSSNVTKTRNKTKQKKPKSTGTLTSEPQPIHHVRGKECNETKTSNKDLKGTYERYRIHNSTIFEKITHSIQSNYKIKPHFYNTLGKKDMSSSHCSQNVYSEPLGKTFMIRGEDYLHDKRKIPSNASIFSLICVENIPISSFTTDCHHSKKSNDYRHDISKESSSYVQKFRMLCKRNNIVPPFILVVNLVLPWGNLCSYYYRSPSSPSDTKNNVTASDKLWNEFLNGTKSYRSSILKLIPRIVSGPWVVKKAVGTSPVIIGKKLPVEYYDSHGKYLEICLDVSNGSQMANSIANIVASKSNLVTVDLGFVLEGHTDEYLPERMLAAFRLNHITL